VTPIEPAYGLPMRILIVEDSSLVRLYYRDVLERAGYHVDQAMNGIEGMEKALADPFDLVIVDVNMPKMDGFSFLQLLRQSDSNAATLPALVITTEAGNEDLQAARAAGANSYLVKPVSESDLRKYAAVLTGVLR
jgi:two-component system chemotaxis response regulator CheY